MKNTIDIILTDNEIKSTLQFIETFNADIEKTKMQIEHAETELQRQTLRICLLEMYNEKHNSVVYEPENQLFSDIESHILDNHNYDTKQSIVINSIGYAMK